MKHNILLLIFALLLMIGVSERVFACGSYQYAPSVCEMYGKSKAVFVGKILTINELKKENATSDFRVEFQVTESFLGVKNTPRVSLLLSGTNPEYCNFEPNKSYLVYAYKGDYGFSIDAGTRTKAVTDATEDLEFLRNLPKTAKGSRLYGTITRAVKSSLEEDNRAPIPAMRLKVESISEKSKMFYTVTDENGRYEVKALPGGKYKISPAKPLDGYYFAPAVGSGEFEVNDKGCVAYDFSLTTKNKFIGKIVDAEGSPLENIEVEILSVNAKRPNGYIGEEYSNTNSDGTFYAYNITPGLYTVSIHYSKPPDAESPFPPVFYPGVSDRSQAAVIEIKAGVDITDFEFRLPARLNERIINGLILWADGTPAAGVKVYLKDDYYDSCCINTGTKTDEQGGFTLIGYETRRYKIWASGSKTASGKVEIYGVSPLFSAENAKPQTIILNLNYEQFEKAFEENEK